MLGPLGCATVLARNALFYFLKRDQLFLQFSVAIYKMLSWKSPKENAAGYITSFPELTSCHTIKGPEDCAAQTEVRLVNFHQASIECSTGLKWAVPRCQCCCFQL